MTGGGIAMLIFVAAGDAMLISVIAGIAMLFFVLALATPGKRPQRKRGDSGDGDQHGDMAELNHGPSSQKLVEASILTAFVPAHNRLNGAAGERQARKRPPAGGLA
jgi:hypothetical protein